MRYVSHEKLPEGDVFMTVRVRRWWAPWTWRHFEIYRAYPNAAWVDRVTGERLGPDNDGRADRFLLMVEADERRTNALLDDHPPRLLSIGGGRR